jgi:hypothetical protein
MSMIAFVANYEDLSTDKGYQFKFYCDKCHNGFLSGYEANTLGTAAGLLEAAGSFFGSYLHQAGETAFAVQRAIGGPSHDAAVQRAVTEGKTHFHQCPRCAQWVCPEVCWNSKVGLCHSCAPNIQGTIAVAQSNATADQINAKVRQQDMISGLDLRTPAVVPPVSGSGGFIETPRSYSPEAPRTLPGPTAYTPVPTPAPVVRVPALLTPAVSAASTCNVCSNPLLANAKFCGECGTPVLHLQCTSCGTPLHGAKFCPECGHKA